MNKTAVTFPNPKQRSNHDNNLNPYQEQRSHNSQNLSSHNEHDGRIGQKHDMHSKQKQLQRSKQDLKPENDSYSTEKRRERFFKEREMQQEGQPLQSRIEYSKSKSKPIAGPRQEGVLLPSTKSVAQPVKERLPFYEQRQDLRSPQNFGPRPVQYIVSPTTDAAHHYREKEMLRPTKGPTLERSSSSAHRSIVRLGVEQELMISPILNPNAEQNFKYMPEGRKVSGPELILPKPNPPPKLQLSDRKALPGLHISTYVNPGSEKAIEITTRPSRLHNRPIQKNVRNQYLPRISAM